MGLALEVGILADLLENDEEGAEQFRVEFDAINRHLAKVNLGAHTEPEDCELWSCSMYGYSGLHYLRRIAAHLDCGRALPPPGGDDSADDPVLQSYYALESGNAKPSLTERLFGKKKTFNRSFDHLILHSDAEGYYLPKDFQNILYPDASLRIAGGSIASSYRLLKECERLASVLGIPGDLDEQSEALFEAADSQGEGDTNWQQYGVESYTCVCLMRGCQKSIETGAALVFC